ncbi:T9SS type A sorting domain-containing protein [Chryseolinea sp. T2]|uniref:T9SS type A sorting domain-containing protein n=1 Tax=Chryseolinea sp. T2 TaxID=3129255 RepID=UPI0030775345
MIKCPECKVITVVILNMIAMILAMPQLFAQQWKFMSGPVVDQENMADVHTIEYTTDFVIAAGPGTVDRAPFYISRDRGNTWTIPNIEWLRHLGEVEPRGLFKCFAIRDNVILAGDQGRNGVILRSTDKGNLWKELPTDFPTSSDGIEMNDFLVYGDTIFLASSHGIHFTRDDGTTWTHVSEGIPSHADVFQMASLNKVLFAATKMGLYVSADAGRQWKAATGIPTTRSIRTIAVTKGILITDGFRSTDGGVSWSPLASVNVDTNPIWGKAPLKGIYHLVVRGDTVVAQTALPVGADVSFATYVSFDSGLTWERSRLLSGGDRYLVNQTVLDFFDFDRNMASDGNSFLTGPFSTDVYGILRSTDLNTWTNLTGKLYGCDMLASSDDYLYASLNNKIYRTSDGETWNGILEFPKDTKIGELFGKSLVVSGSDLYFINADSEDIFDQKGLYDSGDNGESWRIIPLPDDTIYDVVRMKPKVLLQSRSKFYIKDDSEQQWSTLTFGEFNDVKRVMVTEDNRLIAYSCTRIIESIDLGKTWQLVVDLATYFDNIDDPNYDPKDYEDECLLSLAIRGRNFLAQVYRNWIRGTNEYRGGINTFYSNDMGKTGGLTERVLESEEFVYQPAPSILGPFLSTPIGFIGNNGYFYSRTGEIVQSLKDGFPGGKIDRQCNNQWFEEPYYVEIEKAYSPPCNNYTAINDAAVFKDRLFIHAVGGVWSTSLNAITVQPTPEEVTGLEELESEKRLKVFPVPTNSTVKIHYLVLSDNANVQVMDLFGRSIYAGKMGVSEDHLEVELAIQHFARGRYIVRVIDGGKVYTASIIRD